MNISFSMTTPQILDHSKTVTRRLGFLKAKPGMVLTAIEKGMGLKKGEKVRKLCRIRVKNVRREPLCAITPEDVIAEGFPQLNTVKFIELFRRANACQIDTEVTRIEFEYL